MQRIEPKSLIAFARTLEDQPLTTAGRGTRFTLRVREGRLSVTPASTSKPRPIGDAELERVLVKFAESGSLMPCHYQRYSVNASYLLALIERYLGR